MRLILTHEQADLDALASLLAARLLDAEAYALLPRLINRNGQAYLKKYGAALDLLTIRELPNEAIEHVTLVDTQSLVTLKGMSTDMTVNVIDHHPRKTQVNPDWETEIHETGACTTILFEKLTEAGVILTPTEATLMLLGIYEDTGSLAYSSTTARDARAAAGLLDRGADLNIASHYLNPPLTNAQQQLYDRLLKNLTTTTIENNTVIVATAMAVDLNDEISTVGHKMRDFLNPEGLILLVQTRQGIRLVARSTTDELNMADLAQHFGGGGHKRAASALIRAESRVDEDLAEARLERVRQDVIDYLPEIITPALQVKQIMSQKPLVLSPDITVEAAAELMHRYGFEGYPVVQDGRIIGLLNRRNVDRALQHKLPATARDLMDVGEVHVSPGDSINHLQQIMSSSGWGQIPVINPTTGEVIGIVTRTDLISSLSASRSIPSQEDIVEELTEALAPAKLALLKAISRQATQESVQAFIVGGFVRDLLLHRPSQDFDIVIEGDAIHFLNQLIARFGGRAVTHQRFGTAKWIIGPACDEVARQLGDREAIAAEDLPEHLDFITARTEFYARPAALPTVERSSIKMDLHRRDFTINTLALRLDDPYFGKLFDFWGGYQDLQNGQVRVLHALSFVDDATRMLRAIRFACRFGFEIEPRTQTLLRNSLPLLAEVSGARLQHEFNLIFLEENIIEIFAMLQSFGVLSAIHEVLPWSAEIASRVKLGLNHFPKETWPNENEGVLDARQQAGYCLWLEGLTPGDIDQAAERLRLTAKLVRLIKLVKNLREELRGLVGRKPSQVTARLDEYNNAALEIVRLTTRDERQLEVLSQYNDVYRQTHATVTGNALREHNLPPSAVYEQILQRLRAAWLDGEVTNPAEEQHLLEQLLTDHDSA